MTDKSALNAQKNTEKNKKNTENPKELAKTVEEVGGPQGPEPTRYGDWERKGRCIDF